MIFKGGYGRFSARFQVRSGSLTLLPSIAWAIISTVMTISVYYVLLILTKDNSDRLPMCFHTSTFGLLYLYTIINIGVIFVILISKINFIRYPEIASNRWNLMASMGISITRLVGRKVCSSIFAITRQYILGYLLVIACGFTFSLPFSINYLLSLFFIGVILLILLCIIAMSLTVYTKQIAGARYMMFLSFLTVECLMVYFQIYHKDMFQIDILVGLFNLKGLSFITFSALVFVLCYAVILLRVKRRIGQQELLPLDIFDIKPMISGNETELFTSEGTRHTTIFDTDSLQYSPENTSAAEKPRSVIYEEGSEGYQYKFLLILSIILCIISGVLCAVAFMLPNFILERLFGETICSILNSKDSRVLASEVTAVFAVLIILFSILNGLNKSKRIRT